eukprot:Em0019g1136a
MKQIAYEYRAVDILNKQQHDDAYKALNPQRLVPTLEIDGHVLTQSLSIIQYLDETRGPPYLVPQGDTLKRQRVRAVSDVIASGIQPIQNLKVLKYVGANKSQWGKHWIEEGFQGLEELLVVTAGKYCVGDEVSMADLCLVPQVANASRYKINMASFPRIARINEALLQLPAFQVSAPVMQPDCPPELRRERGDPHFIRDIGGA